MKSLLTFTKIAALALTVASFQIAHAKKAPVKTVAKAPAEKMDLEQIWTFNYEELDQLPAKQKDEFRKNFSEEAKTNTVLKKISETSSEESLKTVLASQEKWDAIEQKISNFCQDTHNYASCEKLARVRTDLLFKYSTRK